MTRKRVPNVVGETVTAAASDLGRGSFSTVVCVGTSCAPYGGGEDTRAVSSQQPAAGTEAEEDSNVNIYVNP